MSQAEDYLLKVKVLNNRIYALMRERGIETIAQLHRETGISQGKLHDLINMKVSPLSVNGPDGVFLSSVVRLADFFGVLPDEMFNEQQLTKPLKSNNAQRAIKLEHVLALMSPEQELLPYEEIEQDEKTKLLEDVISTLTPREQKVVRGCFGLDDGHEKTYDELGKELDITRTRVAQIKEKALRKLRSPTRAKPLKDEEDEGPKVSHAFTDKHKEILDNSDNYWRDIKAYNMHQESALKYLEPKIEARIAKKEAEDRAARKKAYTESQIKYKIRQIEYDKKKAAIAEIDKMIYDTIYKFCQSFGVPHIEIKRQKTYWNAYADKYIVDAANQNQRTMFYVDFTKCPEFKDKLSLTEDVVMDLIQNRYGILQEIR